MTHHPTWSEIREKYLSDPEVAAAYEELHHQLMEPYAPVVRDRDAERARCVAEISGYEEARGAL